MVDTLKATTTFSDLQNDQAFQAAPTNEQIQYLLDDYLPKQDADFAKAPQQEKLQYIHEVVMPQAVKAAHGSLLKTQQPQPVPQVTVGQGLKNLAGAVGGGVGSFAQAAINPNTYMQLAKDAGNAVMTESKTIQQHPFMPPLIPVALGAAKGVRDLAQGVASLPSDVANAYLGQNAYHPMIQLPDVAPKFLQQYPVSSFVGQQLPYLLPASKAFKAAKLGETATAALEGAAIGGLNDPGKAGIKGRASNAAMGATIPTVIGVAGRPLKNVIKSTKTKVVSDTMPPVEKNGGNELHRQAEPKRQESGGPEQAQGLENSHGVGETQSNDSGKLIAGTSQEKAQSLKEAVQDFGRSQHDTERMALAEKIYSMAQDVDREVFRESLKGVPQEVIDEIGKRVGC